MNTFNPSLIVRSDSYKVSHHRQYPPGTQKVYSYLESRGGQFSHTVFFGLQYYIKEYLSRRITMEDIDYAEERFAKHFGDASLFNREGWERIVNVHGGILPLEIKAVPEGSLINNHNVLMTVVNTDEELPWVTNYAETLLHKIWYPITVATISFQIRQLIKKYLIGTGDVAGLPFKLHDFGYRGVSSEESAIIGGMAHLINFMGTDTMIAFEAAQHYYNEDMAGFSIPAAEHSTITAWGADYEEDAYRNMIQQFGDGALYAVVSDSYDIFKACENLWGDVLKQEVIDANAMLVIRPDSGDPVKVIRRVLNILGDKFGYTVNEKGYKVLDNVRVIQGDGVDYYSISAILDDMKTNGWSADNIAFGMGGALLQRLDRDTQRFAFKASAIKIDGYWRDVWKDPVTDSGKTSKRGRLKLINAGWGYSTTAHISEREDLLKTVWRNGETFGEFTMQEIRDKIDTYKV